ncbi:MAG: hypothetical protein RBS80_17725 [Thermoguttaceae bacterium]|jgi:hypothetical protein|nr:hypothetical protein [Thermoguttaceae bacterium]
MPSRSVRRRKHKEVQRLQELPKQHKPHVAALVLAGWQIEARRRGRFLHTLPVWALAADPHTQAVAAALDATGELQRDLNRVCADTVAQNASSQLLATPRPTGDRPRYQRSRR